MLLQFASSRVHGIEVNVLLQLILDSYRPYLRNVLRHGFLWLADISMEFSINIILPAALWPCDQLSL